ncbi:hypothetical protein K3495_g1287 [Podosphaera aphanis]|nr:hypothetical protein K3495_g1287 [Podosphaera aphanis]
MLRILEYEELLSKATKIHIQLGHASIGLTQRQLLEKYWHPETMLATTGFEYVGPFFEYIENTFGRPREYVSDNHNAFVGKAILEWHSLRGTRPVKTTPQRPRGNGKVEKANGELKEILKKLIFEQPNLSYETLLDQAVSIYNRRVGPNGYSHFFLMFGTKPPTEQQIYPSYGREHLPLEDKSFAAELARIYAAPLARTYVASLKSGRDQTRAYTQEDKALIRVYGTGDWVLRV